ncbi:chalcone isomerase family protein [Undibacterium sp. LX40W]|uniref:Chalcone isomerase family protein n=1 Tax=Undibacterium nitidum TaxID=2762298 RepID=A0A923HQE2_9BURK|nr:MULTISPECIES: chalcone isomerase family protein [Undibacterium]MBC3882141.1 chalcone isomerase family protein [Undibacterium nitidum]MBC3892422.1 chalcone isomerase family protein [Undibacterium sp. LX40W]
MRHTFSIKSGFKVFLASLSFALVCGQSLAATEVNGVKFEDTVKVAGKDLKLNGAGMRVKAAFFKLYVAGLYLPEKKTTTADILALTGPKRMQIVMQREISSEDFGDAFMKGLNDNSDKAEKSKLVNQTVVFGEMFASVPGLKKGDLLTLDWTPGTGMQSFLNGKQIGQTIAEPLFFNAVLKIWLGERAVDSTLKDKLLGEKN